MRSWFVFSLLVLLALPAAGLEPYLVKDINPVPGPVGSDLAQPVSFGGAVLFFADDGVSGHELWRSDGTAAGTFQLSEAGETELPEPLPFLVTERLYFFLSAQPLTGLASLWVSDGTAGGTFRLTGSGVGIAGWQQAWVAGPGVLYFTARDAEHGVELWRSDGTPAGTRLAADVRWGAESSAIQGLTAYRGLAWFGAEDGQRGGALWRSDGTAAGTVPAVDPVPSSASHGSPEHIRVVGSRLTFFARRQLWAGDGTLTGTQPITSLGRGSAVNYPPAVHGSRLYFVVQERRVQRLWVSDGTGRGTRALVGFQVPFLFELSAQQGLRGRFVFQGFDAAHGGEPWVTDGTPQGTRLLRDVCPGECSSFPVPEKMFAGRLYFSAQRDFTGRELWSTDGTPQGTRRVSDFCSRSCGSSLYAFFVVGNRLLFVATDGETGWEVWRTDGTAQGTVRVTDFESPFVWEEEGFHGAVVNGQLLFGADDGVHGYELWRTDGTAAGTSLLRDLNVTDAGGASLNLLGAAGDRVFFYAQDGEHGHELWRSDGTAAGTLLVHELIPGDEPRGPILYSEHAEAAGDRLFFFRRVEGRLTLWVSDGTAAGTLQLTDRPVCCQLRVAGGRAFFIADDGIHGGELWVSDGTVAGTRMVEDVLPGRSGYQLFDFTPFQGHLYFFALFGSDLQLWRSDGTEAGTLPFNDLLAEDLADVEYPTVHEDRLWLVAGDELWSTDGTAAGTRLELEVVPGPGSVHVGELVFVDGRLFFPVEAYGSASGSSGLWASDLTGTRRISPVRMEKPLAGFEGRLYFEAEGLAWQSDGTEAGTVPLRDRDGQEIHGPVVAVVLGDRLLFSTAESGYSLWETDGTEAGTVRLRGLATNGTGSAWKLFKAGSRALFGSYDPATGHELWAVEE